MASPSRATAFRKGWISLVLLFVLTSLVLLGIREFLAHHGTEFLPLLFGNGLLFALTILSYALYSRTAPDASIQKFIRTVYTSLLLKMGGCLLALGVYLYSTGGKVDKMAVAGWVGLYFLYTFVEIRTLLKSTRQPNHG